MVANDGGAVDFVGADEIFIRIEDAVAQIQREVVDGQAPGGVFGAWS